MTDWKYNLLTELLGCGYADLSVLDDCKYDMCDVIEYCKDADLDVTLNSLAWSMFQIGLDDINRAIDERVDELDVKDDLSEEEQEELNALEHLDAHEDTESFHNFIDTSIWFHKNGDVYREYMSKALDEFEENTGYAIC